VSRLSRVSGSLVSHCHTVSVSHPSAASPARLRASLKVFASSLGPQYSSFDLGLRPFEHPCACQKQPCTKIALRRPGNTISGFPGRKFACNRYRKPWACSRRRTVHSGPVFLVRTDAMIRLRCSTERVSTSEPTSQQRGLPYGSVVQRSKIRPHMCTLRTLENWAHLRTKIQPAIEPYISMCV
jgi:hypothetical protein